MELFLFQSTKAPRISALTDDPLGDAISQKNPTLRGSARCPCPPQVHGGGTVSRPVGRPL